jgi:hypothetical protein
VEEAALDVRVALQQVLPERGDLVDLPVAGGLVDDLDVRVLLEDVGKALGPAWAPVWARAPWVWITWPSPPMASKSCLATVSPM